MMFKMTPNLAVFDPPCEKLGEEWARCLYQLLKLYLRPNRRNTFDGRPLRGRQFPFWKTIRAYEKNTGKFSLAEMLNSTFYTHIPTQ